MLCTAKDFIGIEVEHAKGIILNDELVIAILNSGSIKAISLTKFGDEPLYHKESVIDLISKLPLSFIHKVIGKNIPIFIE